jgi:UDP-2,3-diacylglucosamine pyrophosphatase LpxH
MQCGTLRFHARPDRTQKVSLRSVFISDVHLGSRDCRAAELLKFLGSVEADYLFLVGDIVDFWSLRRTFYWPESHNEVLRVILAMARKARRSSTCLATTTRTFASSALAVREREHRRRYVHSTADGRDLSSCMGTSSTRR